ncbi:hypothetical protein J6590_097726 [Homalodisca vitripennis]|nr:hypothetical protein J6590_097726 [Homalodisca vitripennis]
MTRRAMEQHNLWNPHLNYLLLPAVNHLPPYNLGANLSCFELVQDPRAYLPIIPSKKEMDHQPC